MSILSFKITEWLSNQKLESISTSQYWNDREVEEKKMWSIPNDNFSAFEEYFENKGLFEQFELIIKQNGINLNNNIVASLASGTCTLESLILKKYQGIKKMFCVEKNFIHYKNKWKQNS